MKISTVCGFGIGTSLILKMQIDQIIKDFDLKEIIEVNPADLTSIYFDDCDIIFTSYDISTQLINNTNKEIYIINDFLNKDEIKQQLTILFNKYNLIKDKP